MSERNLRSWCQGLKPLLAVCLVSMIGLSGFTVGQINLPPPSDVRVIIDISGSMKKNDPKNLRRPALNLVTELLPEGDSAGVWTFGQYVNELVRHQPVDEGWRKLARDKAKEINSVALYTNIGAALEKASEDLQTGQDYSNTHFILLTDGVVDISQNPGDNVTERERIQTEVVKRFKALGAKIHTIALSKNADLSLMKRLSLQTGGINALAETSEELSRVFLEAFERASPAEEVPIEGNKFDVDSSVEEFTALIFRAEENTETVIVEPTGTKFSATEHPDYVKWFSQTGYDLITVKQPLEGEWQLEAELAPGSKVTVVSNLRLVVEPLPSNFFAGDQLEIRAGFFEDGQQVLNPSFLDLVVVDVTIKTEDNKSGTKTISKPGEPPADGVFKEKITRLKKVGRYQVIVQADGRTFKRQARQLINLNAPMAAELEATGTGDETRYRIVVSALSPNINIENTGVVSKIRAPDGGNLIKAIPFNDETGRWELDVEPSRGDGIYEVTVRVDGVTQTDNKFRFEPDIIIAEFPRQEASPNEFKSLIDEDQAAGMNDILAQEPERLAAPEPVQDPQPQPTPDETATTEEQEETPPEEEGIDPILLVAAIGGGTLLLIMSGLGFWLFKRKRSEDDLIKKRTAKKEKPAEKPLQEEREEPDLEDEIEQLEQPEPVPEPEVEDDTDDMEFSLEEPEPSDDLDIPEPEPEPEPEPDPEPEDDDDDDDEFNLEDFDISDTDDLPSPDDKK